MVRGDADPRDDCSTPFIVMAACCALLLLRDISSAPAVGVATAGGSFRTSTRGGGGGDAVERVAGMAGTWDVAKTALEGKACALVSNSAELLKGQYGTLINGNDIVARLNLPPFKAHAKHVGNRTDVVFTGYPALIDPPGKANSARAEGYNPRLYEGFTSTFTFLVDAYCANDRSKPKSPRGGHASQSACMKKSMKAKRVCSSLRMRCGLGPTAMLDSAWESASAASLSGVISTGFVGYHMLLSACRCVNVYGFNTSVEGHYWDVTHETDKSHQMGLEHNVIVSTCAATN